VPKWPTRMRMGMAASVIAVTATSTAVLGSFAPAAHASGSCVLGIYCSTTVNLTSLGVLAVKNWTCGGYSNGDSSTGCVDLGTTRVLWQGDATPAGQDWDAFRVDAGWCYRVSFDAGLTTYTRVYDRRGMSSPVYVKVSDDAEANIVGQSASSCP
jgi:hypothetical protein